MVVKVALENYDNTQKNYFCRIDFGNTPAPVLLGEIEFFATYTFLTLKPSLTPQPSFQAVINGLMVTKNLTRDAAEKEFLS